MFIRS